MLLDMISVIVPAYNVASYIRDCVNSIISQSYKNLEVIIVDDGSSDDTNMIIQEMMKTDDRIRYIYQSNQGVSAARNRGLEEAKGEFITFVDADDLITTFFFEQGIRFLKTNGLDCILGQTKFIYDPLIESNNNIAKQNTEVEIYEQDGLLLYEKKVLSNGIVGDKLLDGTFTSGPVCKIFRYKLVEKIRFNTDLIRGEDVIFNLELMGGCIRVGVSKQIWYLYRQNCFSVTKQYNPEVLKSTLFFIEKLYCMYSDRYNMIPFLQVRTIKQIYGALQIGPCSSKSPLSRTQQIMEIKSILTARVIAEIISYKYKKVSFPGSITDKIFFILAKYHLYSCFYGMINVYKKMKKR